MNNNFIEDINTKWSNLDFGKTGDVIVIVVFIVLVLWVLIGFSGRILVLFLFIAILTCLYKLYEKNYIKI